MALAPVALPVPAEYARPEIPYCEAADAIEMGIIFERAAGSRLLAAERLVLSLPAIFREGLESIDLYLSERLGFAAVVRVAGGEARERLARRLAFWCARAGARSIQLSGLEPAQRALLDANLAAAGKRLTVAAAAIDAEAPRFFTQIGAPFSRRMHADPLPVLELEASGPAWESSRWDAEAGTLFVASSLAPPEGDPLVLRVYCPDQPPRCTSARVASVRKDGKPGEPAGFTLSLGELTGDLQQLLSTHGPANPRRDTRAAPRFAVGAPAAVVEAGPGAQAAMAAAAAGHADEPARFTLVDISSIGGLIRGEQVWPVGTSLHVVAALPTGDIIRSNARVAVVIGDAMGIAWASRPASDTELGAAVDRVAAMRKRALVVDDDPLLCQLLGEALEGRGFEVLTASDGRDALAVLTSEILSLDLLIADLRMPNMDGESLLNTVRGAGGEVELAIVLVSGKMDPALESKLLREGADAVLPKALGPRIMAQAAMAVMDRKRAMNSK